MNIQKITKTHLFPKGFTLVELIVVITILAILGTIGFLSIGGYSSKARDSARIGDVTQISKSLDLSIVTTWDYPTPDNSFAITYSGGVVWNQGTIGNNVLQVMKSSISGGGLNKKPTDPLTNKEYTYSELAEGKAYQIKADYEGDLAQTAIDTSLINEATAAPGNPTTAYIRGNFGGLTAKTTVGSNVFILAIPSIMSNTGSTWVPIEIRGTTTLSWALLFHGQNLKSATNFNPNTVVFTGTIADTNKLGLPSTTTEITNMMTLLQSTYSGSNVRASQSVSSLIAMNTGALVDLWKTAVIVQLGGNGGGGGQSTNWTNASCGTANWGTFGTIPSTTPTSNVCATGTLSGSVTGTGPWNWTCNSTNGWISANCSASLAPLYTFTAHTFTNCGTTGQSGPSVATCRTSYNATEVNAWKATYLNMTTNGIQEWIVPETGNYRIDTFGARSGNTTWYSVAYAGRWTNIKWDFALSRWQVIKILVGQQWEDAGIEWGGGGGTFVTTSGNSPLIIAGGGGAPYTGGDTRSAYGDASIGNSGRVGVSWTYTSVGGTGGGGGSSWSAGNAGSGGGGLTGNGSNWYTPSTGGISFTNGWTWGAACSSGNGWVWGFGGGGGSEHCQYWAGAGGGGYSGGGGSGTSWAGGGGGSYNSWTNQTNTAGVGTWHGSVTITKL